MFLTEYNVRGSTVLPKQSITIAFSMDPRMAIEMRSSLDLARSNRLHRTAELLCSATMSKSRFVVPLDHHSGENYDTI
jgi:hypothetical protein